MYNHMVSRRGGEGGDTITWYQSQRGGGGGTQSAANVAIHTVSCCWGGQEGIPSVPHSRVEPSSTTEGKKQAKMMGYPHHDRLMATLTTTH